MRWSVTTPPSGTVLTWNQIKAHVRPGSISEQTYLMDLLASATTYAETMMECALLPQTITAIYDRDDIGFGAQVFSNYEFGFYCRNRWQLPRGPVLSITSVLDTNDNPVLYMRHTAGNADYIIPQQPIDVVTQCPVTVVYQAGFDVVPADILNAIKVSTGTTYLYREDFSNLPANAIHKIDEFYRWRGRGTSVS